MGKNELYLTERKEEFMMKTNIWNADNGDGTYTNPILYTDYSDPDAIRVGEDYYMIASSFCNAPGLPVLHSKDLVNWELINYVVKNVPEERYKAPIHGCGVWAPSIRFHEGVFYVCFPMPDEGIYMSTTKDPYGEWSNPVNIRPGAGWIDPCPFWDEDGKAYLVAGVAKSRIGYKSVIHIVEMQPDGMGLIGEEVKIFDGNINDQVTIEGPKMYKRNGWYYVFAPAGGVKEGWQTVLRSKNPFGPYEHKVVMRQGDSAVNGPHQGAWVDTVTGEDWFIHFQDVFSAGRITHLQPMHWENDWPVIGVSKQGNDYGEPVSTYKKPDVGNVRWEKCEPDTSDDFKGDKLGLQWQWNANYKDEWYELTGEGLILKALKKETVYGDTPSLLLQKWPAPEFNCVTKIDLSNLSEGDEAGIISMGTDYGVVSFAKRKDRIEVKSILGHQNFGSILVEKTDEKERKVTDLSADLKTVYAKYEVEITGRRTAANVEFPQETVKMYISQDGKEYSEALSMVSEPGRWVGTKNGVFCLSEKEASEGFAIVSSVTYNIQ